MPPVELTTFPNNIELITRFDYLPGNEDLYSRRSKLWIAQDTDSDKKYIIKRVIGRQYCENEWKMPSRIDDPSIIKFTHIVHDAEYHYLISEYDGLKDLFSLFAEESGDLEEKTLSLVLEKMAKCIKLCHDKDVLHLDIKMENFLVAKEDPLEIVLIDFGFARDASDTKMKDPNGTDLYVAPEVIDHKICSKMSDIYSLGMVMVHLTTTTDRVSSRQRVRDIKRSKKLSEKYKKVIQDMIKEVPEERITIDQVLETLGQPSLKAE